MKKILKSEIIGPFIAFLVVFLLACISTERFLVLSNLRNLVLQICVTAFLAVGATFVILTGGIDISCGSAVALQTMLFATMIKSWGLSVWAGVVLLVFVGVIMGAFNGFLVSYLKIPAFIATLSSQSMFRGLSYMINNGSALQSLSTDTEKIFYTTVFGLPITLIYIVVFFALAHIFLTYTRSGRKIYAVGGNMEAAQLSGIHVKHTLMLTYSLAGLCTGIAAVLYACRLNSGSQNFGPGMEMSAIAAAVIGGTSMTGGKGKVVATLIGAGTVLIVQNVLNLNSISTAIQQVVNGMMILLAVLLDVWRAPIGRIFGRGIAKAGINRAKEVSN